ncbi:MAG: putative zinc-binding metallopeptidase [Bacteriovoracaceae bacterium]|nr:putative zinc-binding metallopeptidase [Bacteriovoracaceae bacterium]
MSKKRSIQWADLSDEQLLKMRICDLKLKLKNTWVEKQVNKLHKELDKKNLHFKPHVWISDDWYSPDGIAGFAVPFYLLHPRLIELERKMIGEAEGETVDWCMQLMRHEAGHAIDNAFGLRRKKLRQKLFGLTGKSYPNSYKPNLYDKNYVVHLGEGYAQAHPDEDWAETFATWLTPGSNWKKVYAKWPAIEKLELLNEMMINLRGKKPLKRKKETTDCVATLTLTLEEYYQQKTDRFGILTPDRICNELSSVFTPGFSNHYPKASSFLRKGRKELCKEVAKKSDRYEKNISAVVGKLVTYCQERNFHLNTNEAVARKRILAVLTKNSRKYFRNDNKVIM